MYDYFSFYNSTLHSVKAKSRPSTESESKGEETRERSLVIKMDGHDSEDSKQTTADMSAFVQNLLQQMQSRFQAMSDSIITKIDEMGQRIDELEQSINELRNEMGTEGSTSPLAPSKPKPEEAKSSDGSA